MNGFNNNENACSWKMYTKCLTIIRTLSLSAILAVCWLTRIPASRPAMRWLSQTFTITCDFLNNTLMIRCDTVVRNNNADTVT